MWVDMRRDDARGLWAATGLTLAAVTDDTLKDLRNRIDAEMRAHPGLPGFRANPAQKVKGHPVGVHAELTCRAGHFTRREAVTFNSDGFVGFAGWADHENVQPVLRAFRDWVDTLAAPLSRSA